MAPASMASLPHTHADARRFGNTFHAELLIWGDITLAGVIPNLTIVHPLPTSVLRSETTILKDTLTHAQLTNIQDIRLPALTDEPTLFIAFVTGLKYFHAKQYDRAIKYFAASLPRSSTIYIDNVPIFFLRGTAFSFAKKYEDAIADYTTVLNLNPKSYVAYINRGAAYSAQGNYARAIADYTAAIKLSPEFYLSYYNRGVAYRDQGDPGDHARAIADFTTAINLNSEFALAYTNRGIAYRVQGDYSRAIADYTATINLNPKYYEAYNNRGTTYGAQGDYIKAIADFTTAINLNPKYALAYNNRGTAYGMQGDHVRAIADVTTALDFDHYLYYDNYAYKASLCEEMGDITGALEAYRGFIKYAPPQEVLKIDSVKQKIRDLEQHEQRQ
jgi:tetratricopeptide (TPR) repeat protein